MPEQVPEQESPEQLIAQAGSALEKLAGLDSNFQAALKSFEGAVSGGGEQKEMPMPGNMSMEAGAANVKPAL